MAKTASTNRGNEERFRPADAAARQAIAERWDDTLFVVAGAGTGKTTSLVQRIVNLVRSGRTTLDRIAAITFTEAAAADLRERVRQELEQEVAAGLADLAPDSAAQIRCRQGIADLDHATICTLHSFAGQLLRECPMAAGLPPGFDTSDEIVADLKFNDAWKDWLNQVLAEDAPPARDFSLALALNIRLEHIKALARIFHENYINLEGATFSDNVAAPQNNVGALLGERWDELDRLRQCSKNSPGDALFDHVERLREAILNLATAEPGSLEYYRHLRQLPKLTTTRGSQSNWNPDPESGINAARRLKELLQELNSAVAAEKKQVHQYALAQIMDAVSQFVLDYARQRKAEGRAEFHDLLFWARNMLRDRLEIRDHFRQRFTHLLVDESQDTDPVQAEIAMFLAESVPADRPANHQRPVKWEEITPEPGKLFVVGDPKQSIYRFRRADVEQMRGLQQRIEESCGHTVSLVQNFRSRQPIIDWVNYLFRRWMGNEAGDRSESYAQVSYESMNPLPAAAADSPFSPRVWALADEKMENIRIDEIRRQEAADIAHLLRQIHSQGWLKLDRKATENTGRETYVPVNYSDICILIRARTGLPALERALEAGNIPYRLESASLFFETQEARDLLNCLKAIDNPADGVAVVAALRSPAFGCSDVGLLLHHDAGGQFDYLLESADGTSGPVSESLSVLRRFHELRIWQKPGSLLDQFIRDRQLLESAAWNPRMREQWRRYRFMVDRAWQLAGSGEISLRDFISWVEDQISERAQVVEAPVPESDESAVRVMTMHSAKGLEFPVVILTGINTVPRHNPPPAIFDRQKQTFEVSLGARSDTATTKGYREAAAREKEMADAELVRLMYVAATRARDHLVLSLRRPAKSRGGEPPAESISGYLQERPDLWQPVQLDPALLPAAHRTPAEADVPYQHTVAAKDVWVQNRDSLLNRIGRPTVVSATSLIAQARDEEAEPDDAAPDSLLDDKPEPDETTAAEPWRRGRAGTSLGRAVHAVLQSIDLATGAGLDERARAQAVVEGIPAAEGRIVRLARAALDSAIVRRAVAARMHWREVPVAAPLGDGFLHSFIDLMFEEADGLVIVDYKTDALRPGNSERARSERYRLQGGAYAGAVSEATGKPVKEVVFLYLQPRREARLADLAQAVLEARGLALNQLETGGTQTGKSDIQT